MTAETERRLLTDTEVDEPAAATEDDAEHDLAVRKPLFVDEVEPSSRHAFVEPSEHAAKATTTGQKTPGQESTGPTERKPGRPAHAAIDDDATDDGATTSTTTDSDQATAPSAGSDTNVHLWRCARSTVIWVLILMVVVGIAIPAAAVLSLLIGVTAFGGQQILVLAVLGCLAVLVLVFGWRLGLHPRLVADGPRLTIYNPFHTHRCDFADITLFTTGGDGLVIGTQDSEVEAWCVQKSAAAIRADRRTRADKIADELWAIRDDYHRPTAEDTEPVPAEIRFAHHDDADLLTSLERSASMARLTHIFPTDHYGFPEDDIRARWEAVLADRTRQTMIAEVGGEPAGYASIGIETLHHLGVAEDFQRRGIGTELLEAAEDELFADLSIPVIELWVLADNDVARTFYRELGWTDTEDEREAEFPPYPNEIRMVRRNPHLARRGR